MNVQEMNDNSSSASLHDIQVGLEKLERKEWWRWATALTVTLLLTLGVIALSLPSFGKDAIVPGTLDLRLAVPGLLALILLFDVFVVYQQVRISRLRRRLAGQIGVLAALEVLKPADPSEQAGHKERRRAARCAFDQRLTVKARVQGEETILYGRVIDISELGLGAVISGSLERSDHVLLEVNVGDGELVCVSAVIRYARGFRHGFEFFGLGAEEREKLRQVCAAAGLPPARKTVSAVHSDHFTASAL
jgi:PilZ domain